MESNVVHTLNSLLKFLGVPVTKSTISEQINLSPYSESLFAISELLDKWKVKNIACQIPKEQLNHELCPFVAHILREDEGWGFCTVSKIVEDKIYCSNEDWHNRPIKKENFER